MAQMHAMPVWKRLVACCREKAANRELLHRRPLPPWRSAGNRCSKCSIDARNTHVQPFFKRQTAENIFHRRCCRPSRAAPYKQLRSYITWYFAWMKFCTATQKYDIRHSAIQHARRYQYHSKDRKSRQDLDPQGNRTKRSNALLTKLARYRNYACVIFADNNVKDIFQHWRL